MMKVADLFAGVGGMSEGFKMAGVFEVAFAIEYDKDIAYAYERNHLGTEVLVEDISQIDVIKLHNKYPDIDVIIGGPPCQGFSQKGKRMSLNDPRNFLFKQYIRFVREFRPKYFVLENVPNILTTSKGYFKNAIIREFNLLGYGVTCGVLSASDFGVPQDRKRAFFIGQQNVCEVSLPKPQGTHTTIRDAIYDLPFLKSGEGNEISTYDKPATTNYQKLLRGKETTLYNHVATKHNEVALRRLSLIPKGGGKEDLPQAERTKSIYSGTWCRLDENGVAATITTRFDTPSSGRFTHPLLDRCITTREAARIQSFPDSFIFYGTKTTQMKEVGNAVPPLLAKAVAEIIKKNEI